MSAMRTRGAPACGTHDVRLFRRSQNRQLMRGGRA